jgi:hypothetical protein
MAAARVLVVDDEPIVLSFVSLILGSHAYDVVTAPNAESALKSPPVRLPICSFPMWFCREFRARTRFWKHESGSPTRNRPNSWPRVTAARLSW